MACAGDIPTLETLAAVDLLRKHFPDIKIRVVNVVDLMTIQPSSAATRTSGTTHSRRIPSIRPLFHPTPPQDSTPFLARLPTSSTLPSSRLRPTSSTRRKLGDYSLLLLPDSKIRFRAGYSRNIVEGPGFTTIHQGTEQYRSVSIGPSAIHESGHFYFAQTGHSHFAPTHAIWVLFLVARGLHRL
jgi:hypothetical protein